MTTPLESVPTTDNTRAQDVEENVVEPVEEDVFEPVEENVVEPVEDFSPVTGRTTRRSGQRASKTTSPRESWQEFASAKRADRPPSLSEEQSSSRRNRLRRSRGEYRSKGDLGETAPRRRSSYSRRTYGEKRGLLQEHPGWTFRRSSLTSGEDVIDENEAITDNLDEVFEDDPTLSPTDGISSSPSVSSLHAVTSTSGFPASSEQTVDEIEDRSDAGETTILQAESVRGEEDSFSNEDFITAVVVENPISVEPFAANSNNGVGNNEDATSPNPEYLPSSIIADEGSEVEKSSWRNLRRFCRLRIISLFLLSLAIVTLLAAVIVSTTGGGSAAGNNEPPDGKLSTDVSTMSPSVASIDVSSPAPTILSAPPVSAREVRFETLATLVGDAMTLLLEEAGQQSFRDLRDENTPQAKAASWMVSEDQMLQDELDYFVAFPDKVKSFTNGDSGASSSDRRRRMLLLERYAVVVLSMQSASADALLDTLKFVDTCAWNKFGNPFFPRDEALESCLQSIELPKKPLFSGTLPPEIALLHSLNGLVLDKHQFEGPFPQVWGYGLTNMLEFEAENNAITGTIPSSLGRWLKLEFLSLANNKIQSINFFPRNETEESWLPALRRLIFDYNELGGSGLLDDIAHGLSSEIQQVLLNSNNLEGTIPSLLGGLQLTWLDLGSNNLEGTIPPSLFRGVGPTLDLYNNNLTGPALPSTFGDDLTAVDLRGNDLTGTIPAAFWSSSLTHLDLTRNRIAGTLPAPSRGLDPELIVLRLGGNSITGTIPPLLPFNSVPDRSSPLIMTLDLSYNSFTGTIPSNLFSDEGAPVRKLMLQGNQLRGTVPETLLSLPRLVELHIEENNLQGNISFLCSNAVLKITADCEGPDAPVTCDCCENC